jgi:dihydroorotase
MMMPKPANVYLAILIPLIAAAVMAPARAQQGKLDLLIRGGHVIDPRNAINSVMDVGIASGKIAEVAAKIDQARANRVADGTGLYVVPGLIDIHTHVFYGTENTYLSNGHVAV